jgi:hypothetical protein
MLALIKGRWEGREEECKHKLDKTTVACHDVGAEEMKVVWRIK